MFTDKSIPSYFLVLFDIYFLDLTLCALQKRALIFQGDKAISWLNEVSMGPGLATGLASQHGVSPALSGTHATEHPGERLPGLWPSETSFAFFILLICYYVIPNCFCHAHHHTECLQELYLPLVPPQTQQSRLMHFLFLLLFLLLTHLLRAAMNSAITGAAAATSKQRIWPGGKAFFKPALCCSAHSQNKVCTSQQQGREMC